MDFYFTIQFLPSEILKRELHSVQEPSLSASGSCYVSAERSCATPRFWLWMSVQPLSM